MAAWKRLGVLLAMVFLGSACPSEEVLEREDPSARPGQEAGRSGQAEAAEEGPADAAAMAMAYGWSEAGDASTATREALAKLRVSLDEPAFVVAFFSGPYDAQAIHDALRGQLADAKLLGMQSANAVFTPDGVHGVDGGAVALLGFSAEGLAVGVAATPVTGQGDDHGEIANATIAAAMRDAGRGAAEVPGAVLTGQVMGHSERYSKILDERVPRVSGEGRPRAPMIGGNPITSSVELGAVIANDEVYAQGFVVALMYTDKAVGTYFHGGFSGRSSSGVVTALSPKDDHVIVSIDDRPALDVYDEWTQNAYAEFIPGPKGEPRVVNASVLQPLAKVLTTQDGTPHYVTLHPWLFNPDGSINGGVSVAVGDTLHLVEGTNEALVERSGVVVRRAMADAAIPKSALAGGVHIYCVGAGKQLGLGEEGAPVEDIVSRINAQTGAAPYIGGFFGGEQGTVRGHGYFAGNLMSSMMVFSK